MFNINYNVVCLIAGKATQQLGFNPSSGFVSFTARRFDFFDIGMMDVLAYRLEKAESVMRGRDVEVTFRGRIIGKRRNVGGEDEFQVTWSPAKM